MPKKDPSERFELLIRLVRVAKGLDSGGFYNAAKLYWALAFSEEQRLCNLQGIPTADELVREMESAIQGLGVEGIKPELVAALNHGRAALHENRTIPAAEIPPVFVCRACGEIALGRAPAKCPICGARALTWREFAPIYYLEPLHPQQALDALTAAPDDIEDLLRGLSEEQMAQPPSPGEWDMRGALAHLLVAQALLAGRVEKMLTEDNPSLKGVAAWAVGSDDTLQAREIYTRYKSSRQATVKRLQGISVQDWWRTAFHEEFGQVTILQQASYFAKHERSHFPQMDAIHKSLNL